MPGLLIAGNVSNPFKEVKVPLDRPIRELLPRPTKTFISIANGCEHATDWST